MIETLIVLALSACVPDESNLVCRFPAPLDLPNRHVRLDLSCRHPVDLNGTTVPGGAPIRPITEFLNGRGEITLRMPAACSPASLLVTPRVYIAAIVPLGAGFSVMVDNTLENTISISLACRGAGVSGTASTTIPARGQADLSVPVPAKGKVSCVLEKAPEALQESYQFQADAIFQ